MYHIYGIKNCQTVMKTLDFLDKNNLNYEFYNYKLSPPTANLLKEWKKQLGHFPVNNKGPTFRKIKDLYEQATDKEKINLLIENSSALKRPLITNQQGDVLVVGHDENFLKSLL
jgi:arsenate reductase